MWGQPDIYMHACIVRVCIVYIYRERERVERERERERESASSWCRSLTSRRAGTDDIYVGLTRYIHTCMHSACVYCVHIYRERESRERESRERESRERERESASSWCRSLTSRRAGTDDIYVGLTRYIHTCMHSARVYCVHIYREREREYIYIYIERERERGREHQDGADHSRPAGRTLTIYMWG